MSIDDLRPRTPAARPVPDEDDDELDRDRPNLTPERRAELEAAELAAALQGLKDYDEGRDPGMSWEEAEAYIFGPPTPEKIAKDAAEAQFRRARR